ncbi:phosphatidylinositol-glycan biosynthesis class X protein-like isoform X1 [Salvia splendens]|uniref:phosphatidylinositol-glycan biosynthesis class X protein-like isoform X1 n=1 Tax=Salvia splendens TaxID=180675 RepID=UPI001C27A59E|nr:phosphatidylinositol-glycan biosynthesis class X protein-like isoform X1 [Salvia splendens]
MTGFFSSDLGMKTRSMQCVSVIFLISIKSFVLGSIYTCSVDEYIAESYFKKYHSFIEREFDNFIANKIPLGSCKLLKDENLLMVKSLSRNVIGEGSHRWLSSSMRLKFPRELKHELTARSCEVVVIERLPSGVFADPFELQHFVQRGVFTDASVFGDTNLELPSFRSNQTVVEIHMSIDSKVPLRDEDESEIILKVPLHARYQPLGHGFSRVEFGAPDIFVCCSSTEQDVTKRLCQPIPTSLIPDKKGSPLMWEIPCGNKEHAAVVSAVTFGFAISTALLIVLTSVSYSRQ